jgi:hypothetical protein
MSDLRHSDPVKESIQTNQKSKCTTIHTRQRRRDPGIPSKSSKHFQASPNSDSRQDVTSRRLLVNALKPWLTLDRPGVSKYIKQAKGSFVAMRDISLLDG